MNKIALCINVCADDWAAVNSTIVSNVLDKKLKSKYLSFSHEDCCLDTDCGGCGSWCPL